MQVKAVGLERGIEPIWELRLYKDCNGNYFASVIETDWEGSSSTCTATYDDPLEAIAAAQAKMPPDGRKNAG